MKPAHAALAALFAALAAAPASRAADDAPDPALRSATRFLSPELAAQQADDGRNPAMLWVEEGRALWAEAPTPGGRSCADCHGAPGRDMKGVAARHPRFDARTGALLDLAASINRCRSERQGAPALSHDSDDLLGLAALVALQSRGLPLTPRVDGPAARHFETGRAFFHERQGQLNLSCAHCHDGQLGRKLRGDTISSGIGTGFPAYRLEWQGLGSLHRRFSACLAAIRAERFPAGSQHYLALELYLAWRARGQPLEAPALRK